ncbi:MAG TPA: hypothetical protein VFF66_00510 [Brevundimonas sp.]|nr:hypothetical protein [Brevundimonas sp.]
MSGRSWMVLGVAAAAMTLSGCASDFNEFMDDLNRPLTNEELAARNAQQAADAKLCTWYTPTHAIAYYGDCSRSPWDQP